MESNQAAEHLQAIRMLMERSAVYRRALAPIMVYCGVVGIMGGLIGGLMPVVSAREFVLFWAAIAAVALAGSFWLIRRQAVKDSEPFWSPPTRRVAQAILPPFAIAAFLCGLIVYFNANFQVGLWLVPVWCCLYGCAMHAAGFFLLRGIRLFGWLFIILGFLWVLGIIGGLGFVTQAQLPHQAMGGAFGGLHLAYGIYLYFTEPRGKAS